MLVAYIFTKQNDLVVRLIRDRAAKVFVYKDCEYQIHQDKIYFKKFLGIKYFRWTMYVQDNPIPLNFSEFPNIVANQDIPINELAYFVNLLKKGRLTQIAEVAAIISAVLIAIVAYYVYQDFVLDKNILMATQYIINTLQSQGGVPTFP